MDYLKATQDLSRAAAEPPDASLCCVSRLPWRKPGLAIPGARFAAYCGCSTTVHPHDLPTDPPVLHFGSIGVLELLQFPTLLVPDATWRYDRRGCC